MLKHIAAAVLLAAANCAAFAQQGPRPGAMFENADANHDGSIARDEFIAARAEAFAKLDQNSDGVIDDADRRNPPREGGRGERMMARVDANSDGKISKDEFVNGATPISIARTRTATAPWTPRNSKPCANGRARCAIADPRDTLSSEVRDGRNGDSPHFVSIGLRLLRLATGDWKDRG